MDDLRHDHILGGVEIGQQMVELIDEAQRIAAQLRAAFVVEARGLASGEPDRAFESALEEPDRLEQGGLARA